MEVGGNDVTCFDAILDHFEIAHVRGEQGLHATAVDPIHHYDFVRSLFQCREEFRLEHVAVGSDDSDQHAIRAAKLRDILVEVSAHVLVLSRQLLRERSVNAQSVPRNSEHDRGHEREQHDDRRAMTKDDPFESRGKPPALAR